VLWREPGSASRGDRAFSRCSGVVQQRSGWPVV